MACNYGLFSNTYLESQITGCFQTLTWRAKLRAVFKHLLGEPNYGLFSVDDGLRVGPLGFPGSFLLP